MSRITKKITYNIAERGRKYTGQDRSNLDIGSMVNVINSNAVQELVKNGDLYGFYGHEVRQLWGLNPPDTVIDENGRQISIAPAIRTVELSADKNGNVTHRQEFLENDKGEYAYQQYKAKIGGFSSAVKFAPSFGAKQRVDGFFGFDYVRNPNYVTNTSFGVFDGLVIDEKTLFDNAGNPNDMTANSLKTALIAQYDSIALFAQSSNLIDHYQQEALSAQNALNRVLSKQERQQKRQQEIYDSLICQSVPFDEYLKTLQAFDGLQVSENSLKSKTEMGEKQPFDPQAGRSFFDKILGRG